jgi:protein STU2
MRSEMESLRKESERYKREVSRLGRESLGREREELMSSRGRSATEDVLDQGIYDDGPIPPQPQRGYSNGTNGAGARPLSTATTLQRTGSTQSASSRTANQRPGSTFTNTSLSPSEEKENATGFDSLARRKISPPINGNGAGSPVRMQRPDLGSREMSREASDGGTRSGGVEGKPAENWKRAAEVTSQLKARIEAMKVSRSFPGNCGVRCVLVIEANLKQARQGVNRH